MEVSDVLYGVTMEEKGVSKSSISGFIKSLGGCYYVWKFFDKLKSGLSKTKSSFTDKISEVLKFTVSIDDDMYDELEELLITADIGMNTTMEIIENLKLKIKEKSLKTQLELRIY